MMDLQNNNLQIGIVGSMGSGKSTATRCFAALGYDVLSADDIGHQLLLEATNRKVITDHFGTQALAENGQIDRHYLKQRIFAESEQKRWLEKLLHPQIIDTIKQRILSKPKQRHVVEISVFNSDTHFPFLDKMVLVEAPLQTRISRIEQRDQLDISLIQAIIEQQVDPKRYIALIDDVIGNDGSIDSLKKNILQLHHRYNMAT